MFNFSGEHGNARTETSGNMCCSDVHDNTTRKKKTRTVLVVIIGVLITIIVVLVVVMFLWINTVHEDNGVTNVVCIEPMVRHNIIYIVLSIDFKIIYRSFRLPALSQVTLIM